MQSSMYVRVWESQKNFGVWGMGRVIPLNKLDIVKFLCYNAVMN